MRKIVVDGERWRWCVTVGGGDWSEYTPGVPVVTLHVQDPAGARHSVDKDAVTTAAALTPQIVANVIRSMFQIHGTTRPSAEA